MFENTETIIMWAEYGDALFWHKGSGCCGDSRSVVTDSGRVIDLTGIKGLREWYARYDDDKYPAYEWTPEEYTAWRKEGWKYAQAVRDLIPDDIDLVYEYDGDDTGSPVHRKNRVVPKKAMVSDYRLLEEAHDQVWRHHPPVDMNRYNQYLETLCSACKHEELLENAHIFWNGDHEREELIIMWYQLQFHCEFSISRKIDSSKFEIDYRFSKKQSMKEDKLPPIPEYSCHTTLDGDDKDFAKDFAQTLSWLILDRGLK